MSDYEFLRQDPDFEIQDNPTPGFIERLRRRYPTEPEVDRVLTRKMKNRSGPPYQRIPLAEITDCLNSFLTDNLGTDYEISDVRWFTGGVSKIQLGFTLNWDDQDAGPSEERLVVRMDPNEGSNATSRAREFELIKTVEGTVPVPKVFWLDAEGQWFPQPALIYSFARGVTKPSNSTSGKISGLGTNFGPELREALAPQFLDYLAKIHTLEVKDLSFDTLQVPELGTTQSAEWVFNQARRTWEEDRGEDLLIMEVAANWLSRNLPLLDRVSVVHGDYRSGNFLYDEESNQFTAWLDWERGYIGDRHRDLAWMTQPAMGHVGEDGRYYVCGLIPLDEFYDRYQEVSGLTVDPERLKFYRILNAYLLIVSALGSTYRVARLGKSHQDIVLARVEGVVPTVTAELQELLAVELHELLPERV